MSEIESSNQSRTQMVRTERNAVNSQINYLNANNGLAFSVRKKEKRQVV